MDGRHGVGIGNDEEKVDEGERERRGWRCVLNGLTER